MAKSPKIKFVRSEAAWALLDQRMRECNSRGETVMRGGEPCPVHYTHDVVCRDLLEKLECSYVVEETNSPKVNSKLSRVCRKEFPGVEEFVMFVGNPGESYQYIIAYPGTEADLLDEMERTWASLDVENRLEPLLKEEFKQKVHMFLASRSVHAMRGGKHRVREQMVAYCKGYLRAWKDFDGSQSAPKPYVLVPKYGAGSAGVAYLVTTPPKQLLEEAENEFAVQIVMKA